MKPLFRTLVVALCGIFAVGCCGTTESELYSSLPFDMPKVERPDIPNRVVSVCDFGGVGDGVTLNTEAFAKAFSHYKESARIYNEDNYNYTAPLVSGLNPLEKGEFAPVGTSNFWKEKFKMFPEDFICEIRKDPKYLECFE